MIKYKTHIVKLDKELIKFLDDKKLIPRESYKSVLKRLLKIERRKK